jgi:ribosomal protein S18 acetylase RimI-like enzyme
MIRYVEESVANIMRIQPMWQDLITFLEQKSTFHKDEFKHKVFEQRLIPVFEKAKEGSIRLLIAVSENNDVGYCLSTVSPTGVGEVDSIYVHPTYRNRGIGDYFIDDALASMKKQQVNEVVLSVSEGNEDVIGFYQKYGFQHRYYVLKLNNNPSRHD